MRTGLLPCIICLPSHRLLPPPCGMSHPVPFRPDYPLRGVAAVRKVGWWLGVCLWGVMEYVAVAENMG